MKDIYNSPIVDTDSEPEDSGSDTDTEDVDMKSVEKAYAQDGLDTDSDDSDYIESGSSDSEAGNANDSGSSVASSVSTGQNSEVSVVAVSSDEEEPMNAQEVGGGKGSPRSRRSSLLSKEINDDKLNSNLPSTCGLIIENPNELHNLKVQIIPFGGYWQGGTFTFEVSVPEGFNSVPPTVKCVTKVFHPNIGEDGTVGLSILHPSKDDSDSGWKEGGLLRDVVLGIDSLFTVLPQHPVKLEVMNAKAAKLFEENKEEFEKIAKEYIRDNPIPT